jgi:PAS domain S-box-containing protein
MVNGAPPLALKNVRLKYYKTFVGRVAAKAGHLERPATGKKLIAKLRAEIDFLSFKFRSVFDSSRSYYIILDRAMNIIDFNRASYFFVKRLFGKKMVAGDHILDFIHPSSAGMVTEGCNKAIAGEKFTIERRIAYTNKVITWWLFEFSPASDSKGDIVGLVFNANDITKRKAYEQKIALQYKKLGEIAAIQSHEIRGPVCTIMGLMSLIKGADYPPDREYLELLEITTTMLDKNIHDIIDLANSDSTL